MRKQQSCEDTLSRESRCHHSFKVVGGGGGFYHDKKHLAFCCDIYFLTHTAFVTAV